MIKRIILLFFALMSLTTNADERWRSIKTSVIEDSMCIPLLDGTGYLHVDEDVSGLIIQVVGADGTSVTLYDAGTELEDIAVIGTYAAPSANNVRVSPDALAGGDCTQMMFADAVYSGQDWIQIRVTDAQTTIMDFTRWVYLDLLTSTLLGTELETTVGTATSQTEFILDAGESNDDAYNHMRVIFTGGTEKCEASISDYTGSSKTMFTAAACPNMTVAVADTVRIHSGASGVALQVAQLDLDVITGSAGVNVDTDAIGATQIDATFTTEVMASLAFDSGTCDSGSTTTCVDAAAFTTADADYYAKGFAILFTSGTLDKQSACIHGFDPATDKVTFRPALTQAVSTHTYILLAHPTCGGVIAP